MKVLLTTCLLFALLPAVASLQCYTCAGDEEACKHATVVNCEDEEDICVTCNTTLLLGNRNAGFTDLKTCGQSQSWQTRNYSLDISDDISVILRCKVCQTDLCNRKDLTLTRHTQYPENGRQCPACVTLSADSCKANGTITCRGNETKCMYFGITAKAPEEVEVTLAFRGCATPKACNIKTGETEAAGGLITGNITHADCTNAPRSESALEGYVKASQLLLNLPFMGMKLRGEGVGN